VRETVAKYRLVVKIKPAERLAADQKLLDDLLLGRHDAGTMQTSYDNLKGRYGSTKHRGASTSIGAKIHQLKLMLDKLKSEPRQALSKESPSTSGAGLSACAQSVQGAANSSVVSGAEGPADLEPEGLTCRICGKYGFVVWENSSCRV
jgi:hypothetical protein